MTDVFTVQPRDLESCWDRIRPHLERFEKETSRTDAETLKRQIKSKDRQLWGVGTETEITGVVVTEIYETARGLVCWIWAAAGTESKSHEMTRVYQHIENWARDLGCRTIGINGRKGWLRVLPNFKLTAYVMEKEL
jgi:hypothetical protein